MAVVDGGEAGVDTLMYFDFAFWKAEVPRICYFLSETKFVDKRLKREEFQALKEGGELPFDQVPVLYVRSEKDNWITQGSSIMRYVGKKTDFYPADDLRAAKVDEVISLVEELQALISPSFREKDEQKKMAMREELKKEAMPKQIGRFEKLLKKRGTYKYVVGHHMTVADLAIWRAFGWITVFLDGFDQTLVEPFPELKAFLADMNEDEGIKNWISKRPELYTRSS